MEESPGERLQVRFSTRSYPAVGEKRRVAARLRRLLLLAGNIYFATESTERLDCESDSGRRPRSFNSPSRRDDTDRDRYQLRQRGPSSPPLGRGTGGGRAGGRIGERVEMEGSLITTLYRPSMEFALVARARSLSDGDISPAAYDLQISPSM